MATTRTSLPSWLWLWLPLAAAPVQVIAMAVDEGFYRTWLRGERGVVENLTTLSLVVSVACAVLLYRRRAQVASRWFGPFAIIMGLGCFFFAGEEASWGQHWFGYAPPEAIAARNDQGEFNLHNDPLFEKVLDQLPRLALTIAALVGGVIAPLVRGRSAPRRFDDPGILGWIWPTGLCLPSALMVVTVSLPEKIAEAVTGENEPPAWLDFSAGETKELCLGLFLMIYLLAMLLDLRATGRRADALPR